MPTRPIVAEKPIYATMPVKAMFVAVCSSIVCCNSATRDEIAYAAKGAAHAPMNGTIARRSNFERWNAGVANVVSTIDIASDKLFAPIADCSARFATLAGTAYFARLEFGVLYRIGLVPD